MLITAGSTGSMLRDGMVCSAITIWAPTTNGSLPRCGCAACPPVALIRMSKRRGGGEHRAGSQRDVADRNPRLVVHRKDRIAGKLVEEALLHHDPAAAIAFFAGLEDEVDRALEIARRGELARGAEQHRRVPVMAASVHLAVVLRAVGELVQLLHRQAVHVGPKADRAQRVAAP